MLAAVRRQTHIPGADPANGSDRERRSGNALLGTSRAAHARAGRERATMRSGHILLYFERLGHVAINLQSFSVRAGKVVCFCSPNGQ
jgi:hypothetical protein